MSLLEQNEGLAPLLLKDEDFDRASPAEKQRLASDLPYCKQVVACHIAGFDCVAAAHPDAKLTAGVSAPGNFLRGLSASTAAASNWLISRVFYARQKGSPHHDGNEDVDGYEDLECPMSYDSSAHEKIRNGDDSDE
ncbi:hypothetical protein LZC95_00935 [Pendulispora brunnea]|uniref:Uncharacterized protein n=1 Tax=Pendulispora brunnea TaxID=2905690 RepID=A0ABZ2KE91_9BACT